MRIGIDIDDVVTDTSSVMRKYFEEYELSGDGKKYIVEIMRGEIPTRKYTRF